MNALGMTILGFAIIFAGTIIGSAVVFFFKKDIPVKINSLLLGFAAGIMIAASVWSLIIPSMAASESYGALKWLPTAVGFIAGGLFLMLLDHVIPHFHIGTNLEEGPRSHLNKSVKFLFAVTIHNIPEGLAVGFAFGAAAAAGGGDAAYLSALGLAIGIALQNFPEGATVSIPMRNVTGSKSRSFWYGVLSGFVEPVFAVVGFYLSSYVSSLLPWFMAFAGGAMIFVVAEDLIPDANKSDDPHLGTWGVMAGFVVMMILETTLA